MQKRIGLGVLLICALALSAICPAAKAANQIDKGNFSFFEPVPQESLRQLSSDTADKVISPFTVDAGHFQLEGDVVDLFYREHEFQDYDDSSLVLIMHSPDGHHTTNLVPVLFKGKEKLFKWSPKFRFGLCKSVELSVSVNYSAQCVDGEMGERVFTPDGRSSSLVQWHEYHQSSSSFGTIDPGLKINLFGNDGGRFALAVAPGLMIPTEGQGNIMGGLSLPFAVCLRKDVWLKITPGVFTLNPQETKGYNENVQVGFLNSASLTKTFRKKLDAFVNISTTVTTERDTPRAKSDWFGYAGGGLAFRFTRDFQVHTGLRGGLNADSFDINPYFGLSWRY